MTAIVQMQAWQLALALLGAARWGHVLGAFTICLCLAAGKDRR